MAIKSDSLGIENVFDILVGTMDEVVTGTGDSFNEDAANIRDKLGKVKVGCILYDKEETKGDVDGYFDATIVEDDSATVRSTLDDALEGTNEDVREYFGVTIDSVDTTGVGCKSDDALEESSFKVDTDTVDSVIVGTASEKSLEVNGGGITEKEISEDKFKCIDDVKGPADDVEVGWM